MLANQLKSVWAYRGFILGSVQREFQMKYRNSVLGGAWMLINPLSTIAIYTLIFSQIMQARLPDSGSQFSYGIYLCAGILTWGLFAEVVNRSQGVFLENANLLKKLSFPRICLPVVVILNSLLNFAIIFGLFLVVLAILGDFPGSVVFAMLPVLLAQLLFAAGLGITLGVLNVFFRDVAQFTGIVLQFWFWFTPIVYPLSIVPEYVQSWILMNPMTPIISAYQGIFVYGQVPEWSSLIPVLSLGFLFTVLGLYLFKTHSGEMVDEF